MRRILAAALAGALGAACGDNKPPPAPARKTEPKPAPVAAVEEPKAEPVQSIYVYTPIGKRDPFQNVFAVREVTKVKMPGRKPTPLQKWSIDQMRLSMTMTGTSSPFAMIEDPEYYTRPWEVTIYVPYRATDHLTEYICQENNKYLQRLTDDFGQPLFGRKQ